MAKSFVLFPTDKGIDELINEAVKRCSPVLQIDHRHKTVTLTPFDVSLAEIKKTLLGQSLDESKLLSTVLSKIYLSLQRNKLMHALLVPACVVAAACLHTSKKEIDYSKAYHSINLYVSLSSVTSNGEDSQFIRLLNDCLRFDISHLFSISLNYID